MGSNLSSGKIYIRSLVPGGAAERDGRLHAGKIIYDQIFVFSPLWDNKTYSIFVGEKFSIKPRFLRQRLQLRRTKPPMQE